jgi:hypothetical protein
MAERIIEQHTTATDKLTRELEAALALVQRHELRR